MTAEEKNPFESTFIIVVLPSLPKPLSDIVIHNTADFIYLFK